MIVFKQGHIDERVARRRLLCLDLAEQLQTSLRYARFRSRDDWEVRLGDSLLFDSAGVAVIARAIIGYTGAATRLRFALKLSPEAERDYYSHHPAPQSGRVLPMEAVRQDAGTHGSEAASDLIELSLPELSTCIRFPRSLTPPDFNRTPLALLMEYRCDHDLLFANQIAIISELARRVKSSPLCWLRALFARRRGTLKQRLPLYCNSIDRSAQIHPTAVIEGSRIGAGCRIGAHCVVRYSVLGNGVQLHDGAKVEFSAVDDGSWLMHDLVLYRSLVEKEVFLIHGPYQFSYFQHASAAFATIMMDYRPDAEDIPLGSPDGVLRYKGRFLGALVEEGGRVFGGTLTAPGITIPQAREVYSPVRVVRAKDLLKERGSSGS